MNFNKMTNIVEKALQPSLLLFQRELGNSKKDFFIVIGLIIMFALLIFSTFNHPESYGYIIATKTVSSTNNQPVSTTKEKQVKAESKSVLNIQSQSATINAQSTNKFHYTSMVGDTDHPTIDGGIINSVDNIAVYHPSPSDINNNEQHNDNSPSSTNKNNLITTSAKLDDSWATSPKVEAVLQKAASSGKLDYVLQQSKANNLPASVALLPIVESGYNDTAISPKGAVGDWQLMPETARENSLDPKLRTDFISSTNAALSYLNQLHQQYGNWTLAYAAYNAGSNRVDMALAKNPQANSIDDLDLPQETKNYVHSIELISNTLTNNTDKGA